VCFERISGSPPHDALATVRDAAGWCALVPAGEDASEVFHLTRTTFSSEIENSGYVGWLATAIKRRLGSGVVVICGDNPRRGGIFDYLGYPAEIGDAVRAVVNELRQVVVDDPLNLDLRIFKPLEISPDSDLSSETFFEFQERDHVVEASYRGGAILRGYLLGRRDDDRVLTAYTQLLTNGSRRTGTAEMRVEQGADDRMFLTEDYRWSGGTVGRNVLGSEERRAGS